MQRPSLFEPGPIDVEPTPIHPSPPTQQSTSLAWRSSLSTVQRRNSAPLVCGSTPHAAPPIGSLLVD
eukprot:9456893-Pyramimonas_sp.AAC.1